LGGRLFLFGQRVPEPRRGSRHVNREIPPQSRHRFARRRPHAKSESQVARIRASIERFGVCQPILISTDRTIVHGHGVLEAARAAGLTEIPVVFVEHLSPTEQRLLSITLNRIGETGQWDEEA